MSVHSQDLDDLKKKLKSLVSDRITELIVSGEVPYKEIQEMAVDLLDTLDFVTTKEQLALLSKEIGEFYPYLKNESKIMSAEFNDMKEKQVISKLENYFKNLSH